MKPYLKNFYRFCYTDISHMTSFLLRYRLYYQKGNWHGNRQWQYTASTERPTFVKLLASLPDEKCAQTAVGQSLATRLLSFLHNFSLLHPIFGLCVS